MHRGPTRSDCEISFLFHKTYIIFQDSFGNQEIDIKSQTCKMSERTTFYLKQNGTPDYRDLQMKYSMILLSILFCFENFGILNF